MGNGNIKNEGTENKKRRRGFSKKEIIIYSIISAALLIAISVLAYRVTSYYVELGRSRRIAELARQIAAASAPAASFTPAPAASPSPTPAASPPPSAPAPTATPAAASPPTTAPAPAPTPEPGAPDERNILELILNLREAFDNDDIIGYIRIEGTDIDYAVVRADDNDFYLERDLNKKRNAAGSVFMDHENDPENLGRNNIIYGHNMRNGTMFHNMRYYRDKSFFENHRYVIFTTLYEETRWEIFSIYDALITFNYIQVHFRDDAEFMTMVSRMKEKSVFDTGVQVGPEDKILTLSTCTSTSVIDRFVISAKLIETYPAGGRTGTS